MFSITKQYVHVKPIFNGRGGDDTIEFSSGFLYLDKVHITVKRLKHKMGLICDKNGFTPILAIKIMGTFKEDSFFLSGITNLGMEKFW